MQTDYAPTSYAGTTTNTPFSVVTDENDYAAAVERFLATEAPATVPVWTGGRPDLAVSAERAAALYGPVRRPVPRAHGFLMHPETLPAGLRALIAPLATTWLDDLEYGDETDLLIAGRYQDFTVERLWPALRAAAERPGVRLTFLVGRDPASLAWFTAKQYVRPAADVRELGLFTATDRGLAREGVRVHDERSIETLDVRAEMLGTRWRRLFLQGHGKDDSLNLADYTVCGLNEAVGADPTRQGPMCAYQATCYKPVDKLIPLRDVPAAEIVLSSCNNAPFADAAVYDPRYQLMLNAVDGTAQDVVAGITVHDSDRAENRSWAGAAVAGASSVTALNETNGVIQPFPAYAHFGLGDEEGTPPEIESIEPDPLLLTTAARLTAYLGGGLLSPRDRLRPRLEKLATKVEELVTRRARATGDPAETRRSLLNDLQSLDQAVVQQFVRDPDSDLSNYPAHFGERSRLDRGSLTHVRCQCGRPAEQYVRRALVPTALDVAGVICTRCGDVSFRLPEAPSVLIHVEAEEMGPGGSLRVRADVADARPGALRLSLHVARYGRDEVSVEPDVRKVKIAADGTGTAEFTLTANDDAAGQAYYVTVHAVQDLAVTIARRHFGVIPAPGARIQPLQYQ